MQSRVEVDAVGNRGSVRDIDDVGQGISYTDEISLRGSISELANFLDQKIHTKPWL